MSLARDIQAELPTWTGSDRDLATKLGTTPKRIAGERYRMKRAAPKERRTWADRVVAAPHLAAQPTTRARAKAKNKANAPTWTGRAGTSGFTKRAPAPPDCRLRRQSPI